MQLPASTRGAQGASVASASAAPMAACCSWAHGRRRQGGVRARHWTHTTVASPGPTSKAAWPFAAADDVWPDAMEDRKSWRRIEPKFPYRGRWSGWRGRSRSPRTSTVRLGSAAQPWPTGSASLSWTRRRWKPVRRWRFTPRSSTEGRALHVRCKASNYVLSDYEIKAK